MRYKLQMHVTMGSSQGGKSGSGQPFRYRVSGMPAGEEADISRPPHGRWQFRRTKDGVVGDWIGDFETAEDALVALQSDVNA